MTDSKRSELIKELKKHHWSSDGTVGYDWSDEIATFIIAREQAILSEIEKPLRDWNNGDTDKEAFEAIDEALAAISRLRGER